MGNINTRIWVFPPIVILSLSEIEALGLKTFTGAYVVSVTPGGPADQAGIQAGDTPTRIDGLNAGGDIIIAFDGQPINTFDELLGILPQINPPVIQ